MDDQHQDEAVAASERGPQTYTQPADGSSVSTNEEFALSEEGPQRYGRDGVLKVIRPEHHDGPSHATDAATKAEQHRRR